MVFALSMLITGYVLAMSTMNVTVRYLSLLVIPIAQLAFSYCSTSFFMAQGQVSNVVLLTWISNTFARSSSKRAIAIGFMNTIGTSGNILSPSVTSSHALLVVDDANTTPGTYGYRAGARRMRIRVSSASRWLAHASHCAGCLGGILDG